MDGLFVLLACLYLLPVPTARQGAMKPDGHQATRGAKTKHE